MTKEFSKAVLIVPLLWANAFCAPAFAGQTVQEGGTLACVTDKWQEKEVAKGHKMVESASRCVAIPNDVTAPKVSEDCVGKYEYLPDGTWKGSGSCTDTFQGGDTSLVTWEEGSHLKEYTYKRSGGTGKYQGIKGSGTYFYESLTETLQGGRFKGSYEIP